MIFKPFELITPKDNYIKLKVCLKNDANLTEPREQGQVATEPT